MAELANPALSYAQAQAIADDVAKSLYPSSLQAEKSMAAVTLAAIGRHFDISPPVPPKLTIDSEMARQVADLVELFAPISASRGRIEQAIRERFDVRDH